MNRIDSGPNMEFFRLKRRASHSISMAFKNKSDDQIMHGYLFFKFDNLQQNMKEPTYYW